MLHKFIKELYEYNIKYLFVCQVSKIFFLFTETIEDIDKDGDGKISLQEYIGIFL